MMYYAAQPGGEACLFLPLLALCGFRIRASFGIGFVFVVSDTYLLPPQCLTHPTGVCVGFPRIAFLQLSATLLIRLYLQTLVCVFVRTFGCALLDCCLFHASDENINLVAIFTVFSWSWLSLLLPFVYSFLFFWFFFCNKKQ